VLATEAINEALCEMTQMCVCLCQKQRHQTMEKIVQSYASNFSLKHGSSKTLPLLVSGWGMKPSAPSSAKVNECNYTSTLHNQLHAAESFLRS